MEYAVLALSLAAVLTGARLFTNGVEFLGHRLNLSQGAVGSIMAAVGTALPESIIPIIAVLAGRRPPPPAELVPAAAQGIADEIGIGAILGAPFMLATLAMCVAGLAVLFYAACGTRLPVARVSDSNFHRDLTTFLGAYGLALMAALLADRPPKLIIAAGLVALYGWYAWQTVTREESMAAAGGAVEPLSFGGSHAGPLTAVAQTTAALVLIVIGARFFVHAVARTAGVLGVSPFLFSAVVAPIATELPEKFNSIIWIRKGKDTLAFANITGALVFQSTIIPAVGIAMTPWHLQPAQAVIAGLAMASALFIYLGWRVRRRLSPYLLLSGGAFYALFFAYIALSGFR